MRTHSGRSVGNAADGRPEGAAGTATREEVRAASSAGRSAPIPRWKDFHSWFTAVFLLVAVAYCILIALGMIKPGNRLGSAEIILVIAIIVIASGLLERLKEIGYGDLRLTFQELERRQKDVEDQVDLLSVILSGAITRYEYEKLYYLSQLGPFLIRWTDKVKEELYHLDGLRYIEVIKDTCPGGIEQIAGAHSGRIDEFDLKHYVRITKLGEQYRMLRDLYAPVGQEEDFGRIIRQ